MEQASFREESKPASKSLIIGKRQKETLSKQQQTFNRLVKKIEKLQQELKQTGTLLDDKLDFYGRYIHPVQQRLSETRKECAKLLYSFFKNKKLALSKIEKSLLKEVIAVQLNNIFSFENKEPDDELKEIFKAVEGMSYDEATDMDFDNMKEEVQDIFKQYGFNMDFDDMHSRMTQEEINRKLTEKKEQARQQAAAGGNTGARKKTKKQLEREAKEKLVEEVRKKNIGTIYKQLAKVFHPDLELDPEQKVHKEELMKQLTAAYENNDLHTLLRLELMWIQKEENDPEKLSDEKLAVYNQVLKEQAQELEYEIDMLIDHPRYQPLHAFSSFFGNITGINLKQEKHNLEVTMKDMARTITKLKSGEKEAMAEIKEIIRFIKQEQKMKSDIFKIYR